MQRQLNDIEGQIDNMLCDIVFDAQRGASVDTTEYAHDFYERCKEHFTQEWQRKLKELIGIKE